MDSQHTAKTGTPSELTFDLCPVFQVSSANTGYAEEYYFQRFVDLQHEDATESLEQSWRLRAAAGVGLPRGLDQDVYMAIVDLLDRGGGMPENHTLYFTLYELLGILDWPNSGSRRRRLRESLERIASTTISATNAFWSERSQALVSKTFKMFSVSFGHYSDPHLGLRERHRLVFDQFFAEHWMNTRDPGLDLAFYWQLEGHLARRLYRLIDLQAERAGRVTSRSWQVRLDELRDLVPLANYRYASLIKDKLRSAQDQLVDKGYLGSYQYYSPEGRRGPTFVRYEVSSRFDRHRITTAVEQDPFKAAAIQRMLAVTANFEERMSRSSARSLIEEYGAETCLHYAELFPFQKPHGAGLLVRAIKDGYDWQRPSGSDCSRSSGAASRTSREDDSSGNPPTKHGESAVVGGFHGSVDELPSQDSDSSKSVTRKKPEVSSEGAAEAGGLATFEEKQLADEVYQQVVSVLSEDGAVLSVSVWFEGTYARSLNDGVLILVVPNERARDYIGGRFKEQMEAYLSEVLSARGYTGEAELRLVVGEGG